ncbi:MAG: hypothetical protein AAGA95_21510 [Pseudomonadota bacterium]
MHDVRVLIRDALAEVAEFEASLRFALIPEEGEPLRTLLVNVVGRNAARLGEVSDRLDDAVAVIGTDHGGTAEEPTIFRWTLSFDLPTDFTEQVDLRLRQYVRAMQA